MSLIVRSGWAHFRATMAEQFNPGRRRPSFPGITPLCVDDPAAGEGGGGGGTGNNGGGSNAGGAGGGTPEEVEAAKKAEQDKRLTAEAANWRTKYRETETKLNEQKNAFETEVTSLKAQLEELQSRGTATPQGDDARRNAGKPDPELLRMQRQITELSTNLKAVREERDADRTRLRTEQIQRRVSEITSEGNFHMPKIFSRVLAEKVDIAADGEIVLKVKNEAGGIDEVPATLANVVKFKPVDDFESFIHSAGSAGSGGNGSGRSATAANDIDWSKVNGRDLDYIAKNMSKINAAIAAGAGQ